MLALSLMQPDSPDIQQLYTLYGRAVYRRCQYFLRNEDDARDAMQDVFVKVVEQYGTFKRESSPLTWMVRIASNHCLNLLRARKAQWHDKYARTVQVDASQRETVAEQLERHDLVHSLLRGLDRDTQLAATYYFVDEMTQEDAARAAHCSIPTLRKRLRKFIKTARSQIKQVDTDAIFGEPPL